MKEQLVFKLCPWNREWRVGKHEARNHVTTEVVGPGGRELDSYISIHRGLESGPLCGLWFSLGLSDTGGLVGWLVGIPCNDASDSAFSFLGGEREKDPAAPLISPCNARCSTLIFLSLFLVQLLFFCYHESTSIRHRLNDIFFSMKIWRRSVKEWAMRIFILQYLIWKFLKFELYSIWIISI